MQTNRTRKKKKLNFFAIGAPEECDFSFLKESTPKRLVLDYREYDDIFSWLLDGMQKTSNIQVDESVEFSELPDNSHLIDFWD